MFFSVLLKCGKNVVVPIGRCDLSFMPICTFYNSGAVGKKIKIFHSSNKNADSNFDLDILEQFNKDVDACYSGKILDCFCKFYLHFINEKKRKQKCFICI